jgi:hypothetical protein
MWLINMRRNRLQYDLKEWANAISSKNVTPQKVQLSKPGTVVKFLNVLVWNVRPNIKPDAKDSLTLEDEVFQHSNLRRASTKT